MKLEFGCGAHPTEGYVHHDKWKHSPHVDVTFDLEKRPWPIEADSLDEILATDVFEHLRPWVISIQEWLDECWLALRPNGLLNMRLPAYDNPYTWRDPTHYRGFHPESFHYWCPLAPGTIWSDFGRYYAGEGYERWWNFESARREAGDLRFRLRKKT